jgi:hypothetical protein
VIVVKFADGARIREENAAADRRMRTDQATLSSRLDALKPQLAVLDAYDRALLQRRCRTLDVELRVSPRLS